MWLKRKTLVESWRYVYYREFHINEICAFKGMSVVLANGICLKNHVKLT